MAKLILDTSTLLDLTKLRFEEVLIELEEQISQKVTVLLTCDIIIEEWNRNKPRVLQEVIASIRSHAKSALKMAEYLSGEDATELKRIIEKYTNVEAEQERFAKTFFNRIEKLLNDSEKFKIEDRLKLEMADRALTKLAPFHNSKNNMADSLLYFGAIEHVNKTSQIATDLIFVTSNHKEFNSPDDFTKIHPDLNNGNVHFFNNLAQALKMRTETIDMMDEYHEYKFWDWMDMRAEIARGK